ncbi:hypothetical protein DFH09DRAFT_1318296 [Mycena vulgaris]|nr:hypothetical protein DFH09DRAFT_1318296 [Mycena vulgaris]
MPSHLSSLHNGESYEIFRVWLLDPSTRMSGLNVDSHYRMSLTMTQARADTTANVKDLFALIPANIPQNPPPTPGAVFAPPQTPAAARHEHATPTAGASPNVRDGIVKHAAPFGLPHCGRRHVQHIYPLVAAPA